MNPIQLPSRILVERTNLAFAAGAVGASFALGSPRFAISVLVGALLETLNLRALWRSSLQTLQLETPSRFTAVGFGGRFFLLGIVLCIAMYAGAHVVGLLLGLSLAIPAMVWVAWRYRPPVLEDLPALAVDDPEWDLMNPWLARERAPEDLEGDED